MKKKTSRLLIALLASDTMEQARRRRAL